MTQNWFYADSQNQQRGPVDDDGLLAAHARGDVTLNTLVWREGLSNWVPFAHVAGKLGVVVPPPVPRTGRPGTVQVVKSGKSSGWLVIIVIGLAVLFGGGILAAIAIPAYADYTSRAKVAAIHMQGMALRAEVEEYYLAKKACLHNGEGSIKAAAEYANLNISEIKVGPLKENGQCAIRIGLKNIGSSLNDGKILLMTLAPDGSWSETSTLPPRYLPASIRSQ